MPTDAGNYSIKEAAAALNISRNSLHIAVRANEIETFKVRNRRYVPAHALEAFKRRRACK